MEQADRDHEQIMEFGTTRDVVGKPLHRTIRDSVTISLEEDMNLQAIDLLTDMTTCGLSSYLPPGKSKPVNVPSPEVISILTTLTLHPKCTTRIDMDKASKIQWNASHKAIAYLRTLIRLAGATNCELQKAWKFGREEKGDTFEDETNTTRRMRNRDVAKGKAAARGRKGAVIVETNVPFAKLDYAHDENLFKRATDIWSLVGWAMVCSIAYKKRWELWKEFLDLVLETVQQDFNERIEASAKPEDIDLEGSLIYAMGFLPDMVGGAGYKRVVRAIFANGSEKSMNEFTPIFELETKGVAKGLGLRDFVQTVESNLYVTRAGQDEGFQGINDESAAYADFRNKLQNHGEDDGQDEESDDEDQGYLERRKRSKKKGDKANMNSDQEALDQWGGMDAIVMRQKFMCLMSWIFANDNETLNCFYEEYSDNVRSLPINQMLLFTSSTFYPEADPAFRATLIVRILQKSMVFQPKGGWKDDLVNDFVLQEYYLSHFARGTDVESQVRMSVLLELLTRLWHMNAPYGAGLTWSEEMEQSMEAGIKIRREKAEAAAKKKRGISESDKALLELLDIVEVQMRWLMGAAKLTEEKRRTNM